MRRCAILLLAACIVSAAEHRGAVTFGGLPVPGATVTATRGGQHFSTITDPMGDYRFADLPDGNWTFRVEMAGFSPVQREVAVAPGAPAAEWDLQMLPFTGLTATVAPAGPAAPLKKAELKASKEAPAAPPAEPPAATDELSQRAADGFLINGSQNNGASSPFALNPAFGNSRRGMRSLYQGSLGVILDDSSLDARSFSITGQDTPKPAYNRITGVATFGGPLRIPHLFRDGPNFFIGYQWARNRVANVDTGLMPDAAQRTGDFSQFPGTVLDPLTGAPFPGNVIPAGRISPQARALLHLYPLPNFAGSPSYNYQIPVVGATHQDALQSRVNKLINRRNQVSAVFGYMNSRNDNPNLFGFLDTTDMAGLNTVFNWRHSFTPQFYGTLGLQFSRLATRVTPFFANRANVSGDAAITGNDQSPANWGPPGLSFSSGIAPLSDAQAAHNRNQTSGISYDLLKTRNGHNFQFGGGFTRQEFNYDSQQDPRGSFSFTGAGAGSDFASFLLGVPATSSIAYGNADKYFRASLYNLYFTDDWRISPSFTLDAGVRWEYSSPITELYGRLVNLDISPEFQSAAPVVASQGTGPLTGQRYPTSLMNPDKHALQPRVGFAWRPLPASSMVVRGGYGVYYDTSVYQLIALQMAQQSPLSRNFSVQNTPATPLTLANGFIAAPSFATFGVDPNFRIGYAQNWDLSIQRDLPGSLQMTATYLGIKGTRGMQEFFPNTYPVGGVNPCPLCTSGYAYLTSNGNSTRESGEFQLRRRLHNGLTANLIYTFSKSIDDATPGGRGQGGAPVAGGPQGEGNGGGGGPAGGGGGPQSPNGQASPAPAAPAASLVAQNWLDLSAERGLSNFDQRHVLTLQAQYTTGMGVAGGTLLSGWKGLLLKEWTFVTQITAATGMPLNPVYFAPTAGTGAVGNLRPNYTGAPLYSPPPGFHLNPAAYRAPPAGQWGNAGRNSITGPSQFSLDASLARTFRMSDRMSLDVRVDATNALNHVTFPSWNTVVGNAQFGLPNIANPMRSLRTNVRLRF